MICLEPTNTCINQTRDDFIDGEIHSDNQVLKLRVNNITDDEWLYNLYRNQKTNHCIASRKHNTKHGQSKNNTCKKDRSRKKNYCKHAYVFTFGKKRNVKFSLFEPVNNRRKINVVTNPKYSNIIITQLLLLKLGPYSVDNVEKCNHTCHFKYKKIFQDFNTWSTHPMATKNDNMQACFCLPLTHLKLKAADSTYKSSGAPSLQIFKHNCTLCGLCEVTKDIVNNIFSKLIFDLCDIGKTKFTPEFAHLAL